MSEDRRNLRSIGIDLEVTKDCNFACKYCIERTYFANKDMSLDVASKALEKINFLNDLVDSNKIYNPIYRVPNDIKFNEINISYWGGEPTMNPEVINFLTTSLMDNKRVTFVIFTNSKRLSEYYDLINKTNSHFDNSNRFRVQISYDGLPIHNANRIDTKGNMTGHLVRKNIQEMMDTDINFHLKSTIAFDDFDKIYDSYMDICELSDECLSKRINIPPLAYTPTIDYSPISYKKLTGDILEEKKAIFKDQMIKIAQNELERLKQNKPQVFSWFIIGDNNNNRASCSAGNWYYCISYNGKALVCHGCAFTEDLKDHYIADIISDDNESYIKKISNTSYRFRNPIQERNECQSCTSKICYRCNATCYEYSKKKEYIDRWYDYSSRPFICDLYRQASNVLKALEINYETLLSNRKFISMKRECLK